MLGEATTATSTETMGDAPSAFMLCLFLSRVRDYEPGILDKIMFFTHTYTFKDKASLKTAVELWCPCEHNAREKYGHIAYWDVSMVTDMSYIFRCVELFNGDISRWDVSNVTSMEGMFRHIKSFNCDLSSWDVSKVTDMCVMFYYA